jgi:hypothetical protein
MKEVLEVVLLLEVFLVWGLCECRKPNNACFMLGHRWVDLGAFGPAMAMPYCEDWCRRCNRIERVESVGVFIAKRGSNRKGTL